MPAPSARGWRAQEKNNNQSLAGGQKTDGISKSMAQWTEKIRLFQSPLEVLLIRKSKALHDQNTFQQPPKAALTTKLIN